MRRQTGRQDTREVRFMRAGIEATLEVLRAEVAALVADGWEVCEVTVKPALGPGSYGADIVAEKWQGWT